MKQQEKIEKLAKEVMEWPKDWLDREIKVWNPYGSWNDAGMILEKATNWILSMDGDGRIHCTISFKPPPYLGAWGRGDALTAQEAISEAALKTLYSEGSK